MSQEYQFLPGFFIFIFFATEYIILLILYLQTRAFTHGHIITAVWCRPHSHRWRRIQQHPLGSIISTHAHYSVSHLKGTGIF